MARIETEQVNPRSKLSFREQALRAVDDKILAHPFYTGINAALSGFSTPITRSRTSTPEKLFKEMELEKTFKSTTPEEMYYEMQAEQAEQRDPTAEEMFEGTSVVLRDPETVKKGVRKGESAYWRNLQETWGRDWEIAGEYYGTGSKAEDLRKIHSVARQRIYQIWTDKRDETVLLIAPKKSDVDKARKRGKSDESKPEELWNKRDDLVDDKSRLSRLLQAVEDGESASALSVEFDPAYISIMRAFIKDLGLGFQVPYKDLMSDPEYLSSLKKLDSPNLFRGCNEEQSKKIEEEKERIMKQINRGTLQNHGKEKLHVVNVTSIAENFLYVCMRDIKRIVTVLRREGVFVHEIPSIRNGKMIAYYHLIAKGDIEYASGVLNLPEFDDLRMPSVVAYGKKTDEPLPSTSDLQKGHKDGRYKGGGFTLPSKIRRLYEGSMLPVEEIVGNNCPGTVYRERNGSVFIKTEEKDAIRKYFKERYGDLFGK